LKIAIEEKNGLVRCTIDAKKDSREAVWGAAYVLTDRAWASFEPAKGGATLSLRPKDAAASLKELASLFEAEFATQNVRWAILKNNASIREYLVQQALLQAQGRAPAPAAPAGELTTEQRAEIDRLIAEVEEELKTMGTDKPADPKGISATWEERHGKS
jgi:His-Xaa-Ser system protein HxsD